MIRHRTVRAALFLSLLFFLPASAALAYWGVGFSGGWGWYGPSYPPPPYGYGYAWTPPGNWAALELHVHPFRATVFVDGRPAGRAHDFNSAYAPLWLKAGEHILELRHPGHMTLRIRIRARSRAYYDLHYRLAEGEGIDPRSARLAGPPRAKPAEPPPVR